MFSRQAWKEYRALDRRIWVLAAVRAVNTAGLALAMAFMAIYLVDGRGATGALYGAIFLIANLAQAAAQGYAGELSDRFGRRGLMTAALLCRVVTISAIGTLVLFDASIWLIAAVLIASATLRGAFEPVAYALVADVARPEERVAAFGLQRMGTNLGWAIGPVAGGFLTQVIPYGAVFYCAGAALLVSAWATARLDEPATTRADGGPAARVSVREALAEAAERPEMLLLLGGAFLFAVTHVQLFSTLSVYSASELHLSNAEIGALYTVNGIGVLVLQIPAVAAIRRYGLDRCLIAGPLLYVVGFLVFGATGGMVLAALSILILTCGEVITAPSQQAAVAELGEPSRMGRAFGLLGTAQMLGVAIAPLLGGLVYDHVRHQPLAMWSVLAAVPAALAATFVLFAWVRRRGPRSAAELLDSTPVADEATE